MSGSAKRVKQHAAETPVTRRPEKRMPLLIEPRSLVRTMLFAARFSSYDMWLMSGILASVRTVNMPMIEQMMPKPAIQKGRARADGMRKTELDEPGFTSLN